MRVFKLLLCVVLLQLQNLATIATSASADTTPQVQSSSTGYAHTSVDQSSNVGIADASAVSTLGSLYRKSRQSRCVRCYEGRYTDDRSRGYGSYSGRSADERSNWYYPSDRGNDRYDDRYRTGERDNDRYYYEYYRYNRDRDDRYAPRTHDRYEGRGYERFDDRRGSYYDRGESRGYGYDNRDRYSGADRYSDYYSGSGKSTDRYYERPRVGSASPGYGRDTYDRDTYDRYYPRYDFRNYRPWDETYRGQSGFDSSGRGYYFAPSSDSRSGADVGRQNQNSYYRPPTGGSPYLPQAHPETRPCGIQVQNCPYAGEGASSGGGPYTSTATSQTIHSIGIHNGSGSSAIDKNKDGINKGWNYVNDRDSSKGGDRATDLDRDRDRNQQSSSYGGRPVRPLGGSYLLDRDNNVVSEAGTSASEADSKMAKEDVVNMVAGSLDTPEPAVLNSENQAKE